MQQYQMKEHVERDKEWCVWSNGIGVSLMVKATWILEFVARSILR